MDLGLAGERREKGERERGREGERAAMHVKTNLHLNRDAAKERAVDFSIDANPPSCGARKTAFCLHQ